MKKVVIVDLETYTPSVMTNSTSGILPVGGYKPGELVYWMASTPTGKSSLYESLLKNREYMKHEPKSKYQFSRSKWYTVQLHGNATWRHSDEYNQIIDWCKEHFGEHPTKPDAWSRWYVGLGYINFRDAKDYEWYVLRWS